MIITDRPCFMSAPLALAVSLCCAAPALAQSVESAVLAPVVITGSRFDSDPALLPIGATIITADEIRRAGLSDVNSAIRKIGGVAGRQSLDGSPDFTLDLRGFGTNSSQNIVIVVDGVRLSENELSNAVLSTIPIDSVDHIDITRGGSSVLYGDGATGGVINIVTKRAADNTRGGSLYVEGGQFHEGQLRLSGHQSWDGFAADATIGHSRTDNYRDNNDFKLSNFSGGLQWFSPLGRLALRYEGARQDNGLPGALTAAQFQANPRQAATPRDHGALDSDRLTLSGNTRLAGWELAAELSHREKTTDAVYFDYGGSVSTYTVKQDQFSPRLRQVREIGGVLNELVAGIDLAHWTRKA
ncbi:TonB-dependent receptor [Oxalobacteraceae bacterium A2-2]